MYYVQGENKGWYVPMNAGDCRVHLGYMEVPGRCELFIRGGRSRSGSMTYDQKYIMLSIYDHISSAYIWVG